MWITFKVFIEFVTILFLFYVLGFSPGGMWDLSTPTRNQTATSFIERQSLSHWTTREVPHILNPYTQTHTYSLSHVHTDTHSLLPFPLCFSIASIIFYHMLSIIHFINVCLHMQPSLLALSGM